MNYPFKADLYIISSSNTPLYSTGWTYSYTVHSSLQENCPEIAPWVKPELDMSSPSNKTMFWQNSLQVFWLAKLCGPHLTSFCCLQGLTHRDNTDRSSSAASSPTHLSSLQRKHQVGTPCCQVCRGLFSCPHIKSQSQYWFPKSFSPTTK